MEFFIFARLWFLAGKTTSRDRYGVEYLIYRDAVEASCAPDCQQVL